MKKLIPLLFIIAFNIGCTSMLVSTNGGYSTSQNIAAGPTEQTYQVFYDGLAPYGTWITDAQYGYIWMPNVGIGFEPYSTNGHWVYSSVGWTWVSNYNWGWATFHYGRWTYQNGRGWLWIPGHEWGPAWVIWGNVDDYYGWAPMGPGTLVGDGWVPPSAYWNFVPRRYMYQGDLDHYIMERNERDRFSHNVNIIHNRQPNPFENPSHFDRGHENGKSWINIGPRVEEVSSQVNRNIRPVRINEHPTPAGSVATKRDLFIYKPPIMHEEAQREFPQRPAPNKPIQDRPNTPAPPRRNFDDKKHL